MDRRNDYRNMLYRYSTGLGPNAAIDLPEHGSDEASFSMYPQTYNLRDPNFTVEIKREADRMAMQVEDAQRIISNMGSNPQAVGKLQKLKMRMNLINHLMMNFPIKMIKISDLERLYELKAKNSPTLNGEILKVVAYNKGAKGAGIFANKPYSSRSKGYPVYDEYGQVVPEPKKGLSGLADYAGLNKSYLAIGALVIIGAAGGWWFLHRK